METSACPMCGTTDDRYQERTVDHFKLDSWRSGEERPGFVSEPDISESVGTVRIVCVNGHAHPDRVGFELEWADSV
jgi:hypothetical protein